LLLPTATTWTIALICAFAQRTCMRRWKCVGTPRGAWFIRRLVDVVVVPLRPLT
jgi:hypothetical protein